MPVFGGDSPTHGQTLGTVKLGAGDFFLFQILDFGWDGLERESIDVTNMNVLPTTASGGFGNKLKIPSAYVDPGRLVLTVLHDPTQDIPIANPTVLDIQFKIGPAVSEQEAFDTFGFMTKYKVNGPMDGKPATATLELELTDVLADDGSYDDTGAVTTTLAS